MLILIHETLSFSLSMTSTTKSSGKLYAFIIIIMIFGLEHGYIGLSPLRQQEHDTDGLQSSVISPYLKALADFIIPISQLKLIEILGKGTYSHEPGMGKYILTQVSLVWCIEVYWYSMRVRIIQNQSLLLLKLLKVNSRCNEV